MMGLLSKVDWLISSVCESGAPVCHSRAGGNPSLFPKTWIGSRLRGSDNVRGVR